MKKGVLYLLLVCYSLVGAQQNYGLGTIIDSVAVTQNTGETFALYLPTSFDQNTLSPVVFIFDPSAQGKRAVANFIAASEKYGHILVGSNASKNGPYQTNFDIANRLFTKVFQSFNIDPKRIYTSGFSGGARLAATIAVLTKSIQGVIACGSGFSKDPAHIPYQGDFSFAAIVGDQDMNYYELHNTRDFLNKLKIANELFTYNFDHRWPNEKQLLAAFDWLHLEAVKKQVVTKNLVAIQQGYRLRDQRAKRLHKESKIFEAVHEYERIIRNYTTYFGLDSIRNKISLLKKNKEYLKQKRNFAQTFIEEDELLKKFSNRFNSDIKRNKPTLKWWKNELEKLQNRIVKSSGSEQKMLGRIKSSISALAFETVHIVQPASIEKRQFCYDLVILLYPKYPYPYFKQIELFITLKKEEKALDYLEKLVQTGYSNFDRIKNEKTFQVLHEHERFKQLLSISN